MKEKPFELLKRKSGESYGESVTRNFYIARAYVLDLLNRLTKEYSFTPGSNEALHFVIPETGSRMLAVARQLALYAHFINFKEEAEDDLPANRTTITFITDNPNLKSLLLQEEYLCNLPNYCKFVNLDGSVDNKDSYLDIEIHLSLSMPAFQANKIGKLINKEDVDEFFAKAADHEAIFSIDTSKAYYASEMYNIGETIDNLPHEDIHDTHRYSMALDVYQYGKLKHDPKPIFTELTEAPQYKLKEALSNLFCSDCFELRNNAILKAAEADDKDSNPKDIYKVWEKHNNALSVSEHARWVAEKLIMGYRPLNAGELALFENYRLHFRGSEKIKNLKKVIKSNDSDLSHIDLCSYRDLCRIDPDNLKYDSFLTLCIPRILARLSP